jgi:hypothetical protein
MLLPYLALLALVGGFVLIRELILRGRLSRKKRGKKI